MGITMGIIFTINGSKKGREWRGSCSCRLGDLSDTNYLLIVLTSTLVVTIFGVGFPLWLYTSMHKSKLNHMSMVSKSFQQKTTVVRKESQGRRSEPQTGVDHDIIQCKRNQNSHTAAYTV